MIFKVEKFRKIMDTVGSIVKGFNISLNEWKAIHETKYKFCIEWVVFG